MSSSKRFHEAASHEINGKKKARTSASSVPLRVGADESVFRILCLSPRIGGVIGKEGSVVQKIREETDAKIRIEDEVVGSMERVIVVIGKKEDDQRETDENDGTISPAQKALLRVHERILEVNPDKDLTDIVVARLLVPKIQAGSVLGKGGKVIENIRTDSGAQIRILSKEKVPACALPSDEVIQITGDKSIVRKALLAVTDRLIKNPPPDPEQLISRPVNHFPKSLADAEIYQPIKASPFVGVLGDPRYDYYPTVPPVVSSKRESVATANRKESSEEEKEIKFKFLCTNDKVGGIIGKGGIIIKNVQNETGTDIKIVNPENGEEERIVEITANLEQRMSSAQNALLHVFNRIENLSEKTDKNRKTTAKLLVPAKHVGCLLGKGGVIISRIRQLTKAEIRIFKGGDNCPKCVSSDEELVEITGDRVAVQEALIHVATRLQDNIFPEKQITPLATAAYPESLPLGAGPFDTYRSRYEPLSPPRTYSHVGRPIKDAEQAGRRLSYTSDRPSYSDTLYRPWATEGLRDVGSRGLTDYKKGYSSRPGLGRL